jgi:hypothetical protein
VHVERNNLFKKSTENEKEDDRKCKKINRGKMQERSKVESN